jgi:hypothetical protein
LKHLIYFVKMINNQLQKDSKISKESSHKNKLSILKINT